MSNIHAKAIVSPDAQIGNNVAIGPFSVIEPGAIIEDDCRIASHAIVKSGTQLGAGCIVAEHAVLGGLPQHIHVPHRPGRLVIGQGNTIRENCTFHRSLGTDDVTMVGDNNLFMVGVHIAHDCIVGNNVVLTNNVLLAGHVTVEDRAYVGGAAAVHQFCRIGRLAMVGGLARVTQDIPPYMMVDGGSGLIVGLNVVGLRRAGYSASDLSELKAAYRLIFRRGLTWREVLVALREEYPSGAASLLHRFMSDGKRGFTQERRTPPGATVRLHRNELGEEPGFQVKSA